MHAERKLGTKQPTFRGATTAVSLRMVAARNVGVFLPGWRKRSKRNKYFAPINMYTLQSGFYI